MRQNGLSLIFLPYKGSFMGRFDHQFANILHHPMLRNLVICENQHLTHSAKKLNAAAYTPGNTSGSRSALI